MSDKKMIDWIVCHTCGESRPFNRFPTCPKCEPIPEWAKDVVRRIEELERDKADRDTRDMEARH
jgi:hypothetical protein